ncbi:hypothetical protein MBLNU457_6966t1 [Dothideomycetes sp. NU457]
MGSSTRLNPVLSNLRGTDRGRTSTVGLPRPYRGILAVIEEEGVAAVDEVALAVEVFTCSSIEAEAMAVVADGVTLVVEVLSEVEIECLAAMVLATTETPRLYSWLDTL